MIMTKRQDEIAKLVQDIKELKSVMRELETYRSELSRDFFRADFESEESVRIEEEIEHVEMREKKLRYLYLDFKKMMNDLFHKK